MLSSGAIAWLGLLLSAALLLFTWRYTRLAGTAAGRWLLGLRLLALTLAGLLLARVLATETETESVDPEERDARIVLLQDGSWSMECNADERRHRGDLADSLCARLRVLARDRPVRVRRLFFGRDVVTEGHRERLQGGATRLGAALGAVLARGNADAILVVSDGGATDGPVAPFFLDWAANRGIALYAVCAGVAGAGSCDRSIAAVECEPVNPARIAATIAFVGRDPRHTRATLAIDGAEVGMERVFPAPERRVEFEVPDLSPGWHEFALRVEPVEGELTDRNNSRYGVFYRRTAKPLVFLSDRPRIGNVRLARFLREAFPDEVEFLSLRDPRLAHTDFEGAAVVILADVRPDRLPARLLARIDRGLAACLILPGESLSAWARRDGMPIAATTAPVNLRKRGLQEGSVQAESLGGVPGFAELGLEKLGANLLYGVELSETSVVVLTVVSAGRSFPLLVADSVDRPRYVVMLSDTTWKWGLSLDPVVRREYRILLERLFEWLLPKSGVARGADLEVKLSTRGDGRVHVVVVPFRPEWGPRLEEVEVTISRGGRETSHGAERRGGAYVRDVPGGNSPCVIWARASAVLDGRRLHSERMPLVYDPTRTELGDLRLHPERLRDLVHEPALEFAFAAESDELLERMLDERRHPDVSHRVRRRSPIGEILLALLFLFMTGSGWLVERWLPEGGREA